MSTVLELIAKSLPPTTASDVLCFASMAEIHDIEAFISELDLFIHERIESVPLPQPLPAETSEFARIIEALIDTPSLDRDQLEQARLHAAARRKLIEQLHFLTASEVAQLKPGQTERECGDASSTLRNMVDAHQLIGVRIQGQWRYPALQIDPATGAPYEALWSLIEDARSQGYVDWEILHWMVTPYSLPDDTPGQDPFPDNKNISLQEIVDVISARDKLRPPKMEPVSPIDLLRQGDTAEFKIYATEWLGPQRSIGELSIGYK